MKGLRISKRILLLFFVCWITFSSVFISYQKTVEAADWVENLTNGSAAVATITSILAEAGASPLLIALIVGGSGIVTTGYFLDYLTSTSINELKSDLKDFENDIKGLYYEWLNRAEQQRIQAENALLSAEEVLSQAAASAETKVKHFWDNAINVKHTTGDISVEEFTNWQDFCNELDETFEVEDRLTDSSEVYESSNTDGFYVFNENYIGKHITAHKLSDVKYFIDDLYTVVQQTTTIKEIDGHFYIWGANYPVNESEIQFINYGYSNNIALNNYNGVNSKCIPFLYVYPVINNDEISGFNLYYCGYILYPSSDLDRTIKFGANYYHRGFYNIDRGQLKLLLENSGLPVIFGESNLNEIYKEEIINNIKEFLAVDFMNFNNFLNNFSDFINNVLKGISIEEYGRMLLRIYNQYKEDQKPKGGVSSNDREPVKSGNVPIKKSSVRTVTDEETGERKHTGSVGWDIPSDESTAETLVRGGEIARNDVADVPLDYPVDDSGAVAADPSQYRESTRGATGVISVPADDVYPRDKPYENDIDNEAEVEAEKGQDDEDDKDPDNFDDYVNENGGSFYPTGFDLTQLFPFCIPFDIIYLFDKFKAEQAEPPVIEMIIPLPEEIGMGDGYHFTIDFSKFVVLRDILYIFLLLGFIFGLMKLTRNIIRG